MRTLQTVSNHVRVDLRHRWENFFTVTFIALKYIIIIIIMLSDNIYLSYSERHILLKGLQINQPGGLKQTFEFE